VFSLPLLRPRRLPNQARRRAVSRRAAADASRQRLRDPECVTLANALIASTGSPWVHVFGDPM